MTSLDPKIVHMHIPKTAGTALRKAFERSRQDKSRIFPHYDERKYVGINANDYDFFSGHFGYKTASGLGGEIVALLRNPVDRFISVYYFWRQLHEKNIENSVNTRLAAKYSLDEFAMLRDMPSLLEEFYNRMTWQVAYGSMLEHRKALREEGRTDEDVYRLAIANVRRFAVVGVQENTVGFNEKIKSRFGLDVVLKRENITELRMDTFNVPLQTIRRIQEWVYMDLEFYEYVRQISP